MAMARSTGRAGETGIATLPPEIPNGDFEKGLAGWRVVSGKAFAGQPTLATKVGAKDVLIDGPALGLARRRLLAHPRSDLPGTARR